MTFTEAIKREAEEKYQQLDSGSLPSPITCPEMDSFAQFEQKSKKFHKRLADQNNEIKSAFETIAANRNKRLAAEAAEKKRIEDAALAEKKKKEDAERARIAEIRRREEEARRVQWEKQDRVKKIAILGVIAVVILGLIFGIISSNSSRYSASNIVITVEDKVKATQNSSYTNGYVSAFKIKIRNDSVLDILGIEGDMNVYNASGDLLTSTTCIFEESLASGDARTFTLNIDNRSSDEAIELFYARRDDLRVTFKLTGVIYEGNKEKDYKKDAVTILDLNMDSDGVSTTEKRYREAVSLFNQQNYSRAMSLFDALGFYKDSNDYYYRCRTQVEQAEKEKKYQGALSAFAQGKFGEAINALNMISDYKDSAKKLDEIVIAAENKATALAGGGDYVGACAVLEQIGHTKSNSKIYQAYTYAKDNYFADAVRCGLTVVVIPDGIEVIPDSYFEDQYHDYNLQKVVLPATIKTIGKRAFYGCSKLVEINFPDGLTSIGESAFSNCSLLRDIALPSTLRTIGGGAFSRCSSMTSVTLPSSLDTLGISAFSNCGMLSALTIPGNVKTISSMAFQDCTLLTNLTIGDGVEVIEDYAFKGCSLLNTISLPTSLTSIGREAFCNCTALAEIAIPTNVTSIGRYAFDRCSALGRIYFENTEGWRNDKVWSPADFDYKIIDVSDAFKNATRFKSTANYCDAIWTRE